MKKAYLFFGFIAFFLVTNCGSSKNAKIDPYIGAWSILVEGTPQGDVSSTLSILKNEGGEYSGTLNSDLGAFNLNNFKIMENKLSGTFVVQDIDFDLTGNFEDTVFKGFVSGMGTDFKSNGKKIVE
jgi:hypothetical protein